MISRGILLQATTYNYGGYEIISHVKSFRF